MKKQIEFSKEARKQLKQGVDILANAVKSTLGPNGRNVIIEKEIGNPVSTKDGVTVAKSIELEDRIQNIGAQLVKQASIRTADQAGDGTTTSTLLAATILEYGIETIEKDPKVSVVQLKRGLDKACKDVVDEIKDLSEEISNDDELKQIATISANNDVEIGELIAAAIEKVGYDGVVTIEESRTGETYLETVEGVQFNQGFKSPFFVTNNESMTGILDNPYILITTEKIMKAKPIVQLLETMSMNNKSLLIIADDIGGEALSTLVVNKMNGALKVAAVKAPKFGERKKEVLYDIAMLTGGTVIDPDRGLRLDKTTVEQLGQARKVTVSKGETTIVDGKGKEREILEHTKALKAQYDAATGPYEKEQLQERIGNLVGGVAIIHVGGYTELEMEERKDRVEDALHATKAALAEGYLPGGGKALLMISEKLGNKVSELTGFEEIGYKLLLKAIRSPFLQIQLNAGLDAAVLDLLVRDSNSYKEDQKWQGFTPVHGEVVDLKAHGILDPAKVTRLALENAVSVAGTLLTTECIVSNIKEEGSNPLAGLEGLM